MCMCVYVCTLWTSYLRGEKNDDGGDGGGGDGDGGGVGGGGGVCMYTLNVIFEKREE